MFEKVKLALAVLSGSTVTPASQPSGIDPIEITVNGLDQAKQNAIWLTKGLDRTKTTAVRLIDCTSDHLNNILRNKPNLSMSYHRVISSILESRGDLQKFNSGAPALGSNADQTNDTHGNTFGQNHSPSITGDFN
jgi:hypothetical protein